MSDPKTSGPSRDDKPRVRLTEFAPRGRVPDGVRISRSGVIIAIIFLLGLILVLAFRVTSDLGVDDKSSHRNNAMRNAGGVSIAGGSEATDWQSRVPIGQRQDG